MKIRNRRQVVFSAHKLIPEVLVESFSVKGDAVALPVEPVCVSLGGSSVFLGHILHLDPLAKAGVQTVNVGIRFLQQIGLSVLALTLIKKVYV